MVLLLTSAFSIGAAECLRGNLRCACEPSWYLVVWGVCVCVYVCVAWLILSFFSLESGPSLESIRAAMDAAVAEHW